MKSIVNFINENLVNESATNLTVFFDHENPDRIIFVKDIDKEAEKLLNRSSFDVFDNKVRKGGILFCMHNDESFIMNETGFKTMDQLKNALVKDLKDAIKAMTDQNIVDGYDIEFPSLDYFCLSIRALNDISGDEDAVEKAKKLDVKKIIDKMIEDFAESEVDRDSAYAMYFVDIDNEKQVAGSEYISLNFYTSDDVKEMFEE